LYLDFGDEISVTLQEMNERILFQLLMINHIAIVQRVRVSQRDDVRLLPFQFVAQLNNAIVSKVSAQQTAVVTFKLL
jgi:hypothetical protein